MVWRFDWKHLRQRLLPAMHNFFESEKKGISDFEHSYSYQCFREGGSIKVVSVLTR